jgi:hypothetical protein
MKRIIERIAMGAGLVVGQFCFAENPAPDHELFSVVLQDHVVLGLVDYAGVRQDQRLSQYLDQLAKINPEGLPTRDEKLAFWINAYNAYTLKLVADDYPIKSIHDLGTGGRIIGWLLKRSPWDIRFAEVGGKDYTLNEIEHEILRPRFQEPRIHFAIVCAAVSCPPLRAEAYFPDRLGAQLDEQGRLFLADRRHNFFDLKRNRATLSPIFSWFKEDFGGDDESLIRFVASFLDPSLARSLERDAGQWMVDDTDYDWSLNDQK